VAVSDAPSPLDGFGNATDQAVTKPMALRDGSGVTVGRVRHCVGCGYCCSKAPCPYSMLKYCVAHPCPGLYWNGERYRCAHIDDPKLHREVAIGDGCCSTMNTWRGSKIQRRPEIENPHPRCSK
jgi:hypothetical protein